MTKKDAQHGFLRTTMVVIPALNEALCVAGTVRAWLELGVANVRVVDNGSADETISEARSSGAEVLREAKRGYGAAAWKGLQDWPPGVDWVLFSSADGSDRLSIEELAAWGKAADEADLVVGDRVSLPGSRRCLKATQRLGNWLTCVAIQLGWGRRFQDMGSLRLARHAALLALGLQDRGFGWNVEMQVRAIEQGWRIKELPVSYFPRSAGESKISGSLAGTWRAGTAIMRTLCFLWKLRGNATLPAVARRSQKAAHSKDDALMNETGQQHSATENKR